MKRELGVMGMSEKEKLKKHHQIDDAVENVSTINWLSISWSSRFFCQLLRSCSAWKLQKKRLHLISANFFLFAFPFAREYTQTHRLHFYCSRLRKKDPNVNKISCNYYLVLTNLNSMRTKHFNHKTFLFEIDLLLRAYFFRFFVCYFCLAICIVT